MSTTLEDLVYGTGEWREQLALTNAEVLKVISQYP
jgi:hypothetical protein